MFDGVIEKMVTMGVGEEFGFEVCNIEDERREYAIGVKCIQAFDSEVIITGNLGGGFNMIFDSSFNIVDREKVLTEIINEEFAVELNGYKFLRFFEE
jgi:hypothetical protein